MTGAHVRPWNSVLVPQTRLHRGQNIPFLTKTISGWRRASQNFYGFNFIPIQRMGLLWTEKMIKEPKNIGGTTDAFDYKGQIHHRGRPPGCPEREETPPQRGAIGASLMETGMEVCK